MRSKEVEEGIELLKNEILSIKEGLKKGWYYGERYNLEQEIKKKETVLSYISELEDMLSNRIAYTQLLEKDLFENCENYVVSKDKIKELKEKVHKTLDVNGITRAYQMFIDKDFEDLLGE